MSRPPERLPINRLGEVAKPVRPRRCLPHSTQQRVLQKVKEYNGCREQCPYDGMCFCEGTAAVTCYVLMELM